MLSTSCYTRQSHEAIENLRQMRELVCAIEIIISNKNEKKKTFKNKDTHTGVHTAILHLNICYKL